MKSEWRINKNYIGRGSYLYQVYRMLDIQKIDHSGNREVVFSTTDELEAEYYAKRLNKLEKSEGAKA